VAAELATASIPAPSAGTGRKPVELTLLDDYQGLAMDMADWSSLPPGTRIQVLRESLSSEDELVRRLAGTDVLVVVRERTPLPARVLQRLPCLRLVINLGPRNAAIDLGACARLGIATCSAAGDPQAQGATAETAWALILGWHKRLVESQLALRAGIWQPTLSSRVQGKVLGLVGLGRIGQQMARLGAAFGMEVLAWSPHLAPDHAAKSGAQAVDKAALFEAADVVSLHLVLSPSTRGIVGASELQRMKSDALLVNTARADLVQEAVLRQVLEQRRIGGAALDVHWQEPLPAGHWLLALDNVLLSPHLGYANAENLGAYYRNALRHIQDWLAGTPVVPMQPYRP
jgi:phosphoglycerate dehydrogenase-like enzyme